MRRFEGWLDDYARRHPALELYLWLVVLVAILLHIFSGS